MRRILQLAVVVVLVVAGTCLAAPVQCPVSLELDTTFLLSGSAYSCQQQDKIYSDFKLESGTLPSGSSNTLNITYDTFGGMDFHTLAFNGSFPSAFTLTYTITIDPAFAVRWRIVADTNALQTSIPSGNPYVVETVTPIAGVVLSGPNPITSNRNTGQTTLSLMGTSYKITDAYNPNGGSAKYFGSTFEEIALPEPLLTGIVGAALLTFGLVARRKNIA